MSNTALTDMLESVTESLKANTFKDKPPKPALGMVGACPTCGGPIYSSKILFDEEEPCVRFSCECRNRILCGMHMQTK